MSNQFMVWPTPQDYNEALQHPNLSFADADLRQGKATLTPLGLPRPITGGFASVYRMRCGRRDWAVRCFLREYADQAQRYAAISRHLTAAKLPYMVGFDFQPEGIRLNKRWYPILKMEWIEGDLLIDYVRKNLNKPTALERLSRKWHAMTEVLRLADVAHGDLQTGNVLVVRDDLKLIDYDGMYVPSMAGQRSHEIGHRHFQHPKRTLTHFGPGLDNFSSCSIYLSLFALSRDPSLWKKTNAGDESLLFKECDFNDPGSSVTFRLLAEHSNLEVRELTSKFQSMLALTPLQVPPNEQQRSSRKWKVLPGSFNDFRSQLVSRRAATRFSATKVVNSTVTHERSTSQSWINDWLPAKATNSEDISYLGKNSKSLLVVASASMTFSLLVAVSAALTRAGLLPLAVAAGFLGISVGFLFIAYLLAPISSHRRALVWEIRKTINDVSFLDTQIERLEYQKKIRQNNYNQHLARLNRIRGQIAEEKRRLDEYVVLLRDRHLSAISPRTLLEPKPSGSVNARFASIKRKLAGLNGSLLNRKQSQIRQSAERIRLAIARQYELDQRNLGLCEQALTKQFDISKFECELTQLRAESAKKQRTIVAKTGFLNDYNNLSFRGYLLGIMKSARDKLRSRSWSVLRLTR